MQDWLAARAAASPGATALIFQEQAWSYAELDRRVQGLSDALRTLGISPGQRVACLLSSGPGYVCLIHALARLGAVLIPLNTRLTPRELRRQLQHCKAHLLVHDESLRRTATQLLTVVSAAETVETLQSLAASVHGADSAAPFVLEAPQAIVFTSGTTGAPKGAVLTFANHLWSAMASGYRLGVLPGDRWLSSLPLYHVGGLGVVLRSCLYGTTVVLHSRFDADAVCDSLDRDRVTLMSLVPTMLHRLLEARSGPWPSTLRAVLLGGAAAPIALLDGCRRREIPVAATYGLTETASQVATARPSDVLRKPGSVGRPLLFTSVDILDEDGHPLPAGMAGEIVVRGPTIMAGYYRNPEATALILRDGALHSGDVGYLDDEGDLWVLQRRHDVIISGGENIYPGEVEDVLEQHPAVARACVVGLAEAEWGQQVTAMVELKVAGTVTAEGLLAFARQRLAAYKQPRMIAFVDELPLTSTGKIARQQVAEQLSALLSQASLRSGSELRKESQS